jgi:hypothetical protein
VTVCQDGRRFGAVCRNCKLGSKEFNWLTSYTDLGNDKPFGQGASLLPEKEDCHALVSRTSAYIQNDYLRSLWVPALLHSIATVHY